VPVESDGRPRGSFNRWNYNEVYHAAATVSSVGMGQRMKESRDVDSLKSDSNFHRWRQSQRLRNYTTPPPPTPGHHVELEAKREVDWAYDSLSFYLRVSVWYPCNA